VGSAIECPECGEKLYILEIEAVMYWKFCTKNEFETAKTTDKQWNAKRLNAVNQALIVLNATMRDSQTTPAEVGRECAARWPYTEET
jgi:hypothetical protein